MVKNRTIIRRCRLGSSMLAAHSHFMYTDPEICPVCEEITLEDNEHYLMRCKKFNRERKIMISEIMKLNINIKEIDDKLLLGFSTTKTSDTKIHKILKIVSRYIEDTKRFDIDGEWRMKVKEKYRNNKQKGNVDDDDDDDDDE